MQNKVLKANVEHAEMLEEVLSQIRQPVVLVANGDSMVPIDVPMLQEMFDWATRSNRDAVDSTVWLVMGKSLGETPTLWQIAVQARDETDAHKKAQDIAASENRALTEIDGAFLMTEKKALVNVDSDFAILYLVAAKYQSAAIRMDVETD